MRADEVDPAIGEMMIVKGRRQCATAWLSVRGAHSHCVAYWRNIFHRFRYAGRGVVAILCGTLITCPITRAQEDPMSGLQAEAEFVVNFIRFVDWPPGTLKDEHAPIFLCLAGGSAFGRELIETTHGKTFGGRAIEIRPYKHAEDAKHCQVLFISTEAGKKVTELLAEVQNANILTIGETDDFRQQGGILEIAAAGPVIHYHLNVEASVHAHLKISSQFLQLTEVSATR
ncbi:MAG: YfiR family protein [Candidatus Acidiferrales bacterium]